MTKRLTLISRMDPAPVLGWGLCASWPPLPSFDDRSLLGLVLMPNGEREGEGRCEVS